MEKNQNSKSEDSFHEQEPECEWRVDELLK